MDNTHHKAFDAGYVAGLLYLDNWIRREIPDNASISRIRKELIAMLNDKEWALAEFVEESRSDFDGCE